MEISILLLKISGILILGTEAHKDNDYNPNIPIEITENSLNVTQQMCNNILVQNYDKKYLVMSPLSISTALHMCLLVTQGETLEELQNVMGYNTTTFNAPQYHLEFTNLLKDLFADNDKNFTRPRVNPEWKLEFKDIFNQKKVTDRMYRPFEIHTANRFFISNNVTVRTLVESIVKSLYNSEIQILNFLKHRNSTAVINKWIETETNHKIKKIVKTEFPPDTTLVLVNVLYYQASWFTPCDKVETKDFFPNGHGNQTRIELEMMKFEQKLPLYNDVNCDLTAMGLPYQQISTTMYIFLPNDSNREKLLETQKCLTPDKIENIIQNMEKTDAIAWIPKFKLLSDVNLRNNLRKMGLDKLFLSNKSDISLIFENKTKNAGENTIKISKDPLESLKELEELKRQNKTKIDPTLYVHEIYHQVNLKVNEEGTEGAAATAMSNGNLLLKAGVPMLKEKFLVDVPFIFLIRHDMTRLALFYGLVFEPNQKEINLDANPL